MRAVLILLLRELLASGVLTGMVRDLLGGASAGVREQMLETIRLALRRNLWRIVTACVALILLLVALAFLVAGFFLWLQGLLGSPLAAAITGGFFLLLGAGLLWLCGRKNNPVADLRAEDAAGQKGRADGSESAAAAGFGAANGAFGGAFGGAFMDMLNKAVRDLKEGASKNSLVTIALLFLLGLGLGFGLGGSDDDTKPDT